MAAKKTAKKAGKTVKKAAKKSTKKAAKKVTKKSAKKSTKKAAKKTKKSAKKTEEAPKINVQEHVLVPKHEILGKEEIHAFYEKYDVQPVNLPTIRIDDAALTDMDVKIGDIIKISRKSFTAGDSTFYRRVAYE